MKISDVVSCQKLVSKCHPPEFHIIYHARNSCRDFQRLVKHNLLCEPTLPLLNQTHFTPLSRLISNVFSTIGQNALDSLSLPNTHLCRCSGYLGACFKTTSCSPAQSKRLDGIPIAKPLCFWAFYKVVCFFSP